MLQPASSSSVSGCPSLLPQWTLLLLISTLFDHPQDCLILPLQLFAAVLLKLLSVRAVLVDRVAAVAVAEEECRVMPFLLLSSPF